MMRSTVWIGWDMREAAAFAVARSSARRQMSQPIPIYGVVLSSLQKSGLYTRPMEWREAAADKPVMWDVVSDAPMATEFACSRFLVPTLARDGWALFMDCDMLVRSNLSHLFYSLDSRYAVYCVQHNYRPENRVKMDKQVQTSYNRKLWSSFCIFNCDHPSNKNLTLEMINTLPGRDLHRFCWLADYEIGALKEEWNWIPGHSSPDLDPKNIHFTEGGPWFHGYEKVSYADEWRAELEHWAI